jgi:hypothetical protein
VRCRFVQGQPALCGGGRLVNPRLMKVIDHSLFVLGIMNLLSARVLMIVRSLFVAPSARRTMPGYRPLHWTRLAGLVGAPAVVVDPGAVSVALISFATRGAARRRLGGMAACGMFIVYLLSGGIFFGTAPGIATRIGMTIT